MPPPRPHAAPPKPRNHGLTCFWLGGAAESRRFMLVGELSLVTADLAREAIGNAQDATPGLSCDLGDVWFVDLTGLCVLLDAAARAGRAGARVTIPNCPPIVPRMLALLNLRDALDIQAAPTLAPAPRPHARSGPLRLRMSAAELD
jgi:anti-anti-sigma factor